MQLTINKNSSVMKVASYGGLPESDRTDLCSVWWCFWWGLLRAPFWIALFGVLGAAFGFGLVLDPVLTLLVYFKTGVLLDAPVLVIQAVVWVALCVGGYAAWCENVGRRNRVADAASSTADLVRAGYRGWKDRTCVLIAVKG